MKQLQADYLVVGCGAMALAFLDVMVRESDATFVVTDMRDTPGGHWNDAYPFVRLHQPSSYYGVASRPLGRDRIETSGPNEGMYELASGPEVIAYLHNVMNEVILPTGRVSYLPMSEYQGANIVESRMSGERYQINFGKLVDARRIGTAIPLTHERKFEVADGVECIPPNYLPRSAPDHEGYIVLGAGKTATDTVLWLLDRGVDPDNITWVRRRDAWMINRLKVQPGIEFFDETIAGQVRQFEILANAGSIDEVCEAMETERFWLRIDPGKQPEMMHAAVNSEREISELRRIGNVIAMGHVQNIEPDCIHLDHGKADVVPGQLFIDCTASAAAANIDDRAPVFSPGRINLQMVRPYQPTFSAALIGHLEAAVGDEELRQNATRVTPMIDTVEDWIERRRTGALNQAVWNQNDGITSWIRACRLDAAHLALKKLDPGDAEKMAVLGKMGEVVPRAIENMARLLGDVDEVVPAI